MPLPRCSSWIVVAWLGCVSAPADQPRHYVFFNRDRERIADRAFLETRALEGAQLKYTWRELEPEKEAYDFSAVKHDLDFLSSHGKRLFIQLQDVSFDDAVQNVPAYLLRDPEYHGGAARQYQIEGDEEGRATPGGWVARRWDPAVQSRFHRLLNALGQQFDGRVEGVNLPETAVEFGESGRLFPTGFSPSTYRDAVLTNLAALRQAFPRSVVLQYANFMPGEWLPDRDLGLLRAVFHQAKAWNVGLGGPDLLPYKPGQMNHSYPLLRECAASVPTGVAVQWGNYEHFHPRTGKRVTVSELMQFASDELRVRYLFWCTQEPFYSAEVIPALRAGKAAPSVGPGAVLRPLTTLAVPNASFRPSDEPYAVLRRGPLEAVVVDNRAVDDTTLPGHRAGYHGIGALTHQRQSRNIFVPAYAGLNFEHIHDGTTQAREILFEPRHAPMELRIVDAHTAELYQPPTPHWGLESCLRYELLDSGAIQMTFECIPRRATWKNNYLGLFWASYIHQPESLDLHFLAPAPGGGSEWIRGVTPAHGVRPTHRAPNDDRSFAHDSDFPLSLVFNFSEHRAAQPWFFGECRGMVFAQLFRPEDQVRISQSPSGGGAANPAWDFQWFIPEPKVGQRYQLVMRALYLPQSGGDLAERREALRGRVRDEPFGENDPGN